MPIDFNATRKLNELAEALELQDEDLLYVTKFPYTLDTSFKLQFSTLRNAIATLVGSGDVVGPVSASNNNFVAFDGGSGRIIKDSGIDAAFLLNRNNHTGQQPFSSLTSLPTTRSGYGITDASPFIEVKEEGVTITTAMLSINFVGPAVTATNLGGAVTVTIAGGGDMVLSAVQTNSGAKTFNDGTFKLRNGAGTFSTTFATLATSDQTINIPATAGTDGVVLLALAQTLTNKTLTSPVINSGTLSSPQINFGSDAIGDLYFRDASNLTAALPIGSARQQLTVSGGVPAWAFPDYRLLGFATGLNLNSAAPSDLTSIAISGTKYIPLYIVIYNASAAATAATLGLYTAAGAGGTNVVAPVVLSDLTGIGKMQVLAITDLGDAPLTAANLIPRLTAPAGVAATADIAIFGIELPS